MTDTITPNAKLAIIEPTRRNWATAMNRNMVLLDAIVGSYFTVNSLQGVWLNSTAYAVANSVVDPATGVVWQCLVAHTSPIIPTTFLAERTAHPTYWGAYSSPARQRGIWLPATVYSVDDFVSYGNQYAICISTHVSGAVFATDVAAGKWSVLVDMTPAIDAAAAAAVSAAAAASSASTASTQATNAATSATTATTQATNAATSASTATTQAATATTQAGLAATAKIAAELAETNAETAETNAETAETNAAASAVLAASLAAGVLATSTSSVAVGTGAKTFVTQTGKQFQAGQFIKVVDSANVANYMWGTVTSYSGTSLVTNIEVIGGSGTIASWNISIAGSRGAVGDSTPAGVVSPYAGITASLPSGWLFCDGSAVSRTTYAALFAVLSTTYGVGDGSTTFNLPDMRGRAAFGRDDMGGAAASRITNAGSGIVGTTLGASGGAETVTLTSTTMPAHTHAVPSNLVGGIDVGGVGAYLSAGLTNGGTSGSTGTGSAHQNMSPAMILNYIIKV